jgi:hypothetical protein
MVRLLPYMMAKSIDLDSSYLRLSLDDTKRNLTKMALMVKNPVSDEMKNITL